MSAHSVPSALDYLAIPSALDYLDGSDPAVGVVYADSGCTSLATHAHGSAGWRATIGSNGAISAVQVFFYDKGGLARWLTRDEFERVKAEHIEARTTCIMELPA